MSFSDVNSITAQRISSVNFLKKVTKLQNNISKMFAYTLVKIGLLYVMVLWASLPESQTDKSTYSSPLSDQWHISVVFTSFSELLHTICKLLICMVDAEVISADSKLVISAHPSFFYLNMNINNFALFLTLKVHFEKYASILPESLNSNGVGPQQFRGQREEGA